MKLIWTKSNLPLSVAIRKMLDSDCSHFAIVFESPAGGLMFESNLLGTHPKFYRNAKQHFEVVHEINLNIPIELEDKIWDIIIDKYDGKPYDYKAFAYFSWRAILKKCFNIPFPSNNKWNTSGDLCVEIYSALAGIAAPDLSIDLSISSPHQIYEAINGKIKND